MPNDRDPDVVVRPPDGKSWGQMTEEEIQALVATAAGTMRERLDATQEEFDDTEE